MPAWPTLGHGTCHPGKSLSRLLSRCSRKLSPSSGQRGGGDSLEEAWVRVLIRMARMARAGFEISVPPPFLFAMSHGLT